MLGKTFLFFLASLEREDAGTLLLLILTKPKSVVSFNPVLNMVHQKQMSQFLGRLKIKNHNFLIVLFCFCTPFFKITVLRFVCFELNIDSLSLFRVSLSFFFLRVFCAFRTSL